jgi:N-acetylglucosamine kinase-like BadF-type ATPase
MTADHVLAVDTGNTKTVALVAGLDGAVVGRGTSGPGDIYGAAREEDAVTAVQEASEAALAEAGVSPDDIAAVTCCLAGVDWPEDAELWGEVFAWRYPQARLDVRNDGFALLWCLNPAGVGAAITVGTGPAVAARAPGGDTAFLGFWCQDPLGAVGLGEQALRAVHLAELGMAPPTALRGALLKSFGYDEVETLLHHFTRRGAPDSWSRVASAARIVTGCASDGDTVAAGLVTTQVRLLVDYTQAVARRAGVDLVRGAPTGEPWPLAIGGGVIRSGVPLFQDALLGEIADRLPGAAAVAVEVDPVVGSLVGALGRLDAGLAEAAFGRLVTSSATTRGVA